MDIMFPYNDGNYMWFLTTRHTGVDPCVAVDSKVDANDSCSFLVVQVYFCQDYVFVFRFGQNKGCHGWASEVSRKIDSYSRATRFFFGSRKQ